MRRSPHHTTAQRRSAHAGFTLIEMVVVVMIVGILASAAMPLAALNKRRGQEAELRQALRTLRMAIDEHKRAWDTGRIEKKADASGYPTSLDALVQGVPDASSPTGQRIYFLRRLPRDPFADPQLPAAQTWTTRSYASPPDAPAAGADVFDVASRTPGLGLDGQPYRQW
ncbi:type II secretion system protein [Aquabacterium sp. UBA2148]|uniref:type II secretion system protein n=1 Tax=Aquabacterium sp. UBA2148 TaxID=1946042 RepID=UPI00257D723D|nr:type II secretion system protein [Aquabacterium sp. UBA2148]